MNVSPERLDTVIAEWKKAWPEALNAWSKYTRLRSPLLCKTVQESRNEGLSDSFAMIRLVDQAIVIDVTEIIEMKLIGFGVEILAHEIGHHILAPANLTDHARLIARTRYGLPTYERYAPFVANLYTDALINDRLQRSVRLKLADVYIRLREDQPVGQVWNLYMRMYEILWSLKTGTLITSPPSDEMEGDAQLGARVIRSFGSEWLRGAGRFASLLLPYLIADDKEQKKLLPLRDWGDTKDASINGDPAGITDCEPDEKKDAVHPANDLGDTPIAQRSDRTSPGGGSGQNRDPFEYGEILRAAGIAIDDHAAAVRYYREQARKYTLPFPRRKAPLSKDPIPEGLEPWEIGEPFDAVDWQQTVITSPRVIPGLTTVQRVWGLAEGTLPAFKPFDLDLYVDSSGSMANPQRILSYPALAGAILCLAALRAGARVQVTLWSGTSQYQTTNGFIRDEEGALKILTGYFGGSTAFPIHMLRKTYCENKNDRSVHLMVVSDDGVTTMFDRDEKGNSGWKITRQAMQKAGGGGTLVLNIRADWEKHATGEYAKILRARDTLGWDVYPIARWDDLTEFARAFAKRHYHPQSLTEQEKSK
jgi:hypothetical protein